MTIKHYFTAILGAAITLYLIAACQPKPVLSHNHAQTITGKQLFALHCASCHQIDGRGSFINGIPANRNTPLSKQAIIHKIQYGEANSNMPTFSTMPLTEAQQITDYLLYLKQQYLQQHPDQVPEQITPK